LRKTKFQQRPKLREDKERLMAAQRFAGLWLTPLCIFISLIWLTEICQAASSSVAEIIGINGQVESRVRGGAFSPAAVLQKLSVQDAVRTLVNSKAELSFIDQSIVVLGAQTTMEISNYRLGEREVRPVRDLKLVSGKMRFMVNKFFGTGDAEFSVDTPTLGVGVRGTDGIAEIKGSADYVYLFKAGAPVILRSKSTGEQVNLQPGYFAVSQADRPIRIFQLTDDLRRLLLRELNMAFEIRPLGVEIEQDIPLQQPGILAPEAGPRPPLPPVYTPPVPVPVVSPHAPSTTGPRYP
jgi:hypothetical protein